MTYKELTQKYTEEVLPTLWEETIKLEQKAELLLYYMLSECLSNLCPVNIFIESDDPIINIIRSWRDDESNSFGSNAFTTQELSNGALMLCITYNLYKITEDMETMSSDMFGRFDVERLGEKAVEKDYDLSEVEMNKLFNKVQLVQKQYFC